MFNDHLLVYDLENISEARKLAILCSSLCAGYRICIDLCPEDDVTYDTVIARLGNRFAPTVSVIYVRSVFHRRVQSGEENCVQFVTALRSLLAKIDYAEAIRSEILKDRFVARAVSDKIRESLMLEDRAGVSYSRKCWEPVRIVSKYKVVKAMMRLFLACKRRNVEIDLKHIGHVLAVITTVILVRTRIVPSEGESVKAVVWKAILMHVVARIKAKVNAVHHAVS